MNKHYHYQVNYSQQSLLNYPEDADYYTEENSENKFKHLSNRRNPSTFGEASRKSSFLEISKNPTSPGQYIIQNKFHKPVMPLDGYSKRINDNQQHTPGVGSYKIDTKLIPQHKVKFNRYEIKKVKSQDMIGPGSYDSLSSSLNQGPQFTKSERKHGNSDLITPGVGAYEIKLPRINKSYTFKKNFQAEKTEKLQNYRESIQPSPFSYSIKKQSTQSPSCVWSKMSSKKITKQISQTPGPGQYMKSEQDMLKKKKRKDNSFLITLPESYRQLLNTNTLLENPYILSQIQSSPTYKNFTPQKKIKFKLMLKNFGFQQKKIQRKKSYIPGPGEYNMQEEKVKNLGFAQSLRKYEFLATGSEANPGPASYTDSIKEITSKGGQISRAKKPELFQIIEGPGNNQFAIHYLQDPAQYDYSYSTFEKTKVKKKNKKQLSINLDELANIVLNFS